MCPRLSQITQQRTTVNPMTVTWVRPNSVERIKTLNRRGNTERGKERPSCSFLGQKETLGQLWEPLGTPKAATSLGFGLRWSMTPLAITTCCYCILCPGAPRSVSQFLGAPNYLTSGQIPYRCSNPSPPTPDLCRPQAD